LTSFKQGRFREAVKYYDRALEIDPGNAETLNNRGLALHMLKDDGEAIKSCDRAIEKDPTSVYAWTNKGFALFNQQKYREAVACFDRALELDPAFDEAKESREEALRAIGQQ